MYSPCLNEYRIQLANKNERNNSRSQYRCGKKPDKWPKKLKIESFFENDFCLLAYLSFGTIKSNCVLNYPIPTYFSFNSLI
jgi:hypothetical protein